MAKFKPVYDATGKQIRGSKLRKWREERAGYYKKIDAACCFYCGGAAETFDHLVPVAWAAQQEVPSHLKLLLSCCCNCNFIAGCRFFLSYEEKRAWIGQLKCHSTREKLDALMKAALTKKALSLKSAETGNDSVPQNAGPFITLLPIVWRDLRGGRYMRVRLGLERLQSKPKSERNQLLLSYYNKYQLKNPRRIQLNLTEDEDAIEFLQEQLIELYSAHVPSAQVLDRRFL